MCCGKSIDTHGKLSEWLFDVARGEVTADCPREVRFLGNARIDEICYQAVDSFEFRTW